MPMIKIGQNHINTDRIVNVVTPATQGDFKNGAKLVFAGSPDEWLWGEDADAIRDWLAGQVPPAKPEAPAPTPAAPIVTKADPAKPAAAVVTK